MSGEWPEDPTAPRCPACGEPVSATASFCMHCETDLPPANFGPTESTDTAPVDDTAVPADSTTTSVTADVTETDPGMPTGDERDDRGWFHPGGPLDTVPTLMVGIVTGLIAGILLLPLGIWAFPTAQGGLAFPIAVFGWLATTGWVA